MSWIYVAVAAAAVVGGTSAAAKNRVQQRQVSAQAQAADYNAAILKQKADQTATVFNLREETKRRANRIEAGKRAAAIAQSGTGFMGSNTAFAEQQDVQDELDALNIRYEGNLDATGLLAQSNLEHFNAENYRATRSGLAQSLLLDTASGAISGAASVYGVSRGGGSSGGGNSVAGP